MITKILKDYTFEYNPDNKRLVIIEKGQSSVALDKVRWFSLLRFCIRCAYSLNTRRKKVTSR